ncbi:transposase Tn3 [Rhodoferax antarcticus ANT.BR]|uniref:Transposase Tn3 n=1 Tax=Rhodoferax antarcticus ANT.BR TaxID=1111071 RepID=A0A1Q8YHB8_9BURK|nr:hypothetical protein RA876_00770 [Rhodoferax antarcticus]OLP07392.1 transposase Tn3 [Rhodoferax antarcticus ANT.BR]
MFSADPVYRCGKGHTEPLQSDKYSGEVVFTPLELIDRIAQLVPPPRTHRHRYYGVLAPNSPFRAAVTAMVPVAVVAAPKAAVIARQKPLAARSVATWRVATRQTRTCGFMDCHVLWPRNDGKPTPRPPLHYLWGALIARIYEVFPLLCPMCGGQMRIIAFITFSADIHKILEHIGVDPEAPRITPARGPPLWEGEGAQETGEGVEAEPDWDLAD